MRASAFAPANLSCIFRIVRGDTPETTHSLGIGFTIDKGVTATASLASKAEVLLHGKHVVISPVSIVLAQLTDKPLLIELSSELLFGCGFGLSGAATLASAYAVNALLSLGKTAEQLAMLSHAAEVMAHTGLGDITAQYLGGFLMKSMPGSPLEAERLGITGKAYYKVFGPLDTASVITDRAKEKLINMAGEKALEAVSGLPHPSFPDILKVSLQFAEESGLLADKQVRELVGTITSRGGHASMIMLGNAVFSDSQFKGCEEAMISEQGAYVL